MSKSEQELMTDFLETTFYQVEAPTAPPPIEAMVEDIHPEDQEVRTIRQGLAHWSTQRNYEGKEWDGVESFNLALAKLVDAVAIEAAGWYKYPSSKRSDKDGKDWRLVTRSGVAINCHSLLHDDVWSLATTIYKTNDINLSKLKFISDSDPRRRALLWSLEVAKVLETDGYKYDKAKDDMRRRLAKLLVAGRIVIRGTYPLAEKV